MDWIEKDLLFAAATETKLWWLVTSNGKTFQVEVSGIQNLGEPIWKIEQRFANSVAKVSVPVFADEEETQMPKQEGSKETALAKWEREAKAKGG